MTPEKINLYYAQVTRWAFPVLIVILLVSLFTCNKRTAQNDGLEKLLNDSEKRTIQLENDRGQLVAQNEQILTMNKKSIEDLTDSIFNLNRKQEKLIADVLNYYRITQNANFRDKFAGFIKVPVKDPNDSTKIVYIEQPQDTNLIRVPQPFAYSDSTIRFAGEVRRTGVLIDSVHVPNTLHLRTLTQKTGFLNLGRKTVVQALNSNSAIVNSGIASVAVKNQPSAWNRWIKPILFGAAGSFITYKIVK